MCVIQAPRSFTFGRQEVTMPQTDCEVILAGDCRSSHKQLLVTIKPASNQGKTAERVSVNACSANSLSLTNNATNEDYILFLSLPLAVEVTTYNQHACFIGMLKALVRSL